jgi:hypothetical protein
VYQLGVNSVILSGDILMQAGLPGKYNFYLRVDLRNNYLNLY